MQYGISTEQEMIANTVRSFVEKEIYPHEELVERNGEVPAEIAQDIKQKTLDLGFYACNFPESVGCAGLNHMDFALVERELGRGSMALNHFFGRPQSRWHRPQPPEKTLCFLGDYRTDSDPETAESKRKCGKA